MFLSDVTMITVDSNTLYPRYTYYISLPRAKIAAGQSDRKQLSTHDQP